MIAEDGGSRGDRAASRTRQSQSGSGSPSGPTPRRSRATLATLNDVAAELARLYRRADRGEIAPGDATKMAFILVSLGRVLEAATLETRLSALEAIADESRSN